MRQRAILSKGLLNTRSPQSISRRLAGETTKFTSTVSPASDIKKSMDLLRYELRQIIERCVYNTGTVSYGDRIITSSLCDFHRLLIEWSRHSDLDRAVKNIVLSSLCSIEVMAGGSGILAAMMLVGDLECGKRKRFPKEVDVRRLIRHWLPSGVSVKVANEIFSMGACGCEVTLEEGNQLGTVVKCTSGMKQRGSIDNLMISKLTQKFKARISAHVIAIDGIVESVGQLHKILEASKKEYTLILARGFLPDVSNTLAMNYPENLKCIPFIIDEWCVDSFLDLEKLGVECVSSETGSVISNVDIPEKIDISIDPEAIILSSLDTNDRKIVVSFGKDLDSLKGISMDRSKLLLALIRFTSRAGFINLSYSDKEFSAPWLSYDAAQKCSKSIQDSVQSLGAIITYKKRK